jgi:hypothetical protein
MRTQVKSFQADDVFKLEQAINTWAKGSNAQIVSVSLTSYDASGGGVDGWAAMVTYNTY